MTWRAHRWSSGHYITQSTYDRDSHHKLDKSAKITHAAGCGEGRRCNQQLAALLLISAAVVIVMIAATDGCDDAVLSVAVITYALPAPVIIPGACKRQTTARYSELLGGYGISALAVITVDTYLYLLRVRDDINKLKSLFMQCKCVYN